MISMEAYKKALGAEANNLSDQQIEDLKIRQEKLADMLFDSMFFSKTTTNSVNGPKSPGEGK